MHQRAAPVQSYRELVAWQKAVDLVTEVYTCTRSFPDSERFGLVSQLRRAAVSVPSNIAEGQGRASTGEFRQFLGHALGSLLEIETQLLISNRLGFLGDEQNKSLLKQSAELGRILNGLKKALESRLKRSA